MLLLLKLFIFSKKVDKKRQYTNICYIWSLQLTYRLVGNHGFWLEKVLIRNIMAWIYGNLRGRYCNGVHENLVVQSHLSLACRMACELPQRNKKPALDILTFKGLHILYWRLRWRCKLVRIIAFREWVDGARTLRYHLVMDLYLPCCY